MKPGTGFSGDTGTCVDVTSIILENVSVYNVDVNGMEENLTVIYRPIIKPPKTTEAESEPEQLTASFSLQQQRLRTRM